MKKKNTGAFLSRENGIFGYVFLSAIYGIIFLRLSLACLPHGELTKSDYFLIYVLGWIFSPLSGFLFSYFLEKIRRKMTLELDCYYSVFIFLNFIYAILVLHPSQWGEGGAFTLLEIFLFFQMGAIGLLKILGKKYFFQTVVKPKFVYSLLIFFFVGCISTLPGGWLGTVGGWTWVNFFLFLLIGCLFYFGTSKSEITSFWRDNNKSLSGWNFVFGSLVFLLTAYLVIDPHFPFVKHENSFYLGPLAEMRAGKSLLANINAQYGVLVFYFLRLFFAFLPIGYRSLCLVVTALTVLQYFLFYLISLRMFRSKVYSLFCLFTLILINHFAPTLHFPWVFPSVGPLRFGFIYLLMVLVILRNQHENRRNYFLVWEAATVATAFFWSFEVCVYTVTAYLGLVFYESVVIKNDFVKRILMIIGFGCVILFFLYLDIYCRTRDFPHWSHYFDYIFLYQGGFGMVPIPAIGYWWVIIGILYASFFSILGITAFSDKKESEPAHLNAIVLLTFYGILQFVYYLDRADFNNLLNISMPSLMVLFYWMYYLRHFNPPGIPVVFKGIVFGLAAFFVGIYLQQAVPIALQQIKSQTVSFSEWIGDVGLACRDSPRDDSFAETAKILMGKYSGGKRSLIYFFGERGVEVSMYLGKTEAYPYDDIVQADICDATINRILSFDAGIVPGDYIYTSEDMNETYHQFCDVHDVNLEQKLFSKINRRFKLKRVDYSGGISVYRVAGKS